MKKSRHLKKQDYYYFQSSEPKFFYPRWKCQGWWTPSERSTRSAVRWDISEEWAHEWFTKCHQLPFAGPHTSSSSTCWRLPSPWKLLEKQSQRRMARVQRSRRGRRAWDRSPGRESCRRSQEPACTAPSALPQCIRKAREPSMSLTVRWTSCKAWLIVYDLFCK